jgi:hypothetical protein
MIPVEAALFASTALVLLLLATATLFGTRRFQYRWSMHLRPTFYVVSRQLLTLPLVAAGYLAIDQKQGWGLTQPWTLPCDLPVDDFAFYVRQWADEHGYERTNNAYGAESHAEGGTLRYASYRLQPRSTLDRWQYTRRFLLRPRPTMRVTCLASSENESAMVLVELPWVGLDSPEQSLWLAVVEDLAQHLGSRVEAEADIITN